MQLIKLFNSSLPVAPQVVNNDSVPQKPPIAARKLSMIWVKELDGTQERLVARWTMQD